MSIRNFDLMFVIFRGAMLVFEKVNEAEIEQRESQLEEQKFVFARSFTTNIPFVWLFLFQSQKSN